MLFKECNANLSKAVPKLSPNVSTWSYFIDYAKHFSYRMHHQYIPKILIPKYYDFNAETQLLLDTARLNSAKHGQRYNKNNESNFAFFFSQS